MKKPPLVLLFLVLIWSTIASAQQNHFNISLDQRVAYQTALEQVYWKHMIWPAENPKPKPALEAVMPQSAVRLKTKEYLRKSNALDSFWHRPITAEHLQAEMDRMARETMNAELLEQLWAALENDPYLIAECLARPLLVERLTTGLTGFDEWWKHRRSATSTAPAIPAHHYRLPQINHPSLEVTAGAVNSTANSWKKTNSADAPAERHYHSAVWTGTQMIVWGGLDSNDNVIDTGASYTPATNSWTATTKTGAPSARDGHSAIWTGTQLIIWGGYADSALKTGGLYDPMTNSWNSTTRSGSPSSRSGHSTVWTGTEMIVWGGFGRRYLKTGGRYDPSTNTWRSIKTKGAPSKRFGQTVVWTGTEMIVWGGFFRTSNLAKAFDTGARYNPATNSWTPTTKTGAPSKRFLHTAVWTGSEMIVWGGGDYGASVVSTGGRYNPSTNSWKPTTITKAPSARGFHTAVWTGSEMIIWGGSFSNLVQTGAVYKPSNDSWGPTITKGAPSPRRDHTAIWTGTEMIVWGGQNAKLKQLKTGGRFTP
jgi:N-acetylneuraminic acid mutarotase